MRFRCSLRLGDRERGGFGDLVKGGELADFGVLGVGDGRGFGAKGEGLEMVQIHNEYNNKGHHCLGRRLTMLLRIEWISFFLWEWHSEAQGKCMFSR